MLGFSRLLTPSSEKPTVKQRLELVDVQASEVKNGTRTSRGQWWSGGVWTPSASWPCARVSTRVKRPNGDLH